VGSAGARLTRLAIAARMMTSVSEIGRKRWALDIASRLAPWPSARDFDQGVCSLMTAIGVAADLRINICPRVASCPTRMGGALARMDRRSARSAPRGEFGGG